MSEPAFAMPACGDEPIMDLAHLQAFTDGDASLEAELVGLYLTSAEHYLAGMATALAAGQSWTASAHALKGASLNFGARRTAALARAAEHGTPDAAQHRQLRASVDEVRQLFAERSR